MANKDASPCLCYSVVVVVLNVVIMVVLLTRWLPDVSQDAVTRSRGYGDHGDFSLETAVLERMRY